MIARLILACLLGGIIGYEREYTNRPAGFRTHILVCVGATLVMITSEFIFERYSGRINADPARLGAQVISGIGFLGAGTIIRNGFNVRGLTTAASLWAVSCVGIALGIGFYYGAIVATVIIFLTLITLKKIERNFARRNRYRTIFIETENAPGRIGAISSEFYKQGIRIRNIEFSGEENEGIMVIKFLVRMPNCVIPNFLDEIRKIDGILKVYEE